MMRDENGSGGVIPQFLDFRQGEYLLGLPGLHGKTLVSDTKQMTTGEMSAKALHVQRFSLPLCLSNFIKVEFYEIWNNIAIPNSYIP